MLSSFNLCDNPANYDYVFNPIWYGRKQRLREVKGTKVTVTKGEELRIEILNWDYLDYKIQVIFFSIPSQLLKKPSSHCGKRTLIIVWAVHTEAYQVGFIFYVDGTHTHRWRETLELQRGSSSPPLGPSAGIPRGRSSGIQCAALTSAIRPVFRDSVSWTGWLGTSQGCWSWPI